MRRIIYKPQVQAFVNITLDDGSKQTLDLTDDLISGEVQRRLNALSTTTLQVQNKYAKYTGSYKIRPMDRIVILMSRMTRPFLVFSGYVDEATYYQIFPDAITIKASCTLKLLEYTYFDPGLPFMQQFFSDFGLYNPSTGVLTDYIADLGNFDVAKGIGHVLFKVLNVIGQWPKENIHIKQLPNDFLSHIAKIMTADVKQEQLDLQKLEKRLTSLFSAPDTTPINLTGAPGGSVTLPAGTIPQGNVTMENVIKALYAAGLRGEDLPTMGAIAGLESSLNSKAVNPNNTAAKGLWQTGVADLQAAGLGNNASLLFDPVIAAQVAVFIYNRDKTIFKNAISGANFSDPIQGKTISLAEAKRLYGDQGQFLYWGSYSGVAGNTYNRFTQASTWSSYLQSAAAAALNLTSGSVGSGLPGTFTPDPPTTPPQTQSALRNPISYTSVIGRPFEGTHGKAFNVAGGSDNWESENAVDLAAPFGSPVYAVDTGKIGNEIGALPDGTGRFAGLRLHLVTASNEYYYAHLSRLVVTAGETVGAGQLLGYSGEANGVNHLHFASKNGNPVLLLNLGGDLGSGSTPGSGYAGTTPGSTAGNQNTPDPNAPITLQDVTRIGFLTGFTTLQLTTSDSTLSYLLTGKRALANDIPLMEWVIEMTQASGRIFCSAPNGDFYAFFPDYFGMFKRTPYFYISETEMVDLNVQLNDTQLVTHLYATGPLLLWNSISPMDRTLSEVASVQEEAFKFWIDINNPDDPIISQPFMNRDPSQVLSQNKFDPIPFLQKYGARPYTYDLPQVRNPVLIWMAAWMQFLLMWSQRFTTSASFTFMPELFPGGIVNLANRLTMFVQSVTHTFDLESGFQTTAELVAPAFLNIAQTSTSIPQVVNNGQ